MGEGGGEGERGGGRKEKRKGKSLCENTIFYIYGGFFFGGFFFVVFCNNCVLSGRLR